MRALVTGASVVARSVERNVPYEAVTNSAGRYVIQFLPAGKYTVTIGAADMYGLPVSTTHILSSGIAGTMAANRSGLQKETLRNILLAWVFTLPACMILGSVLFAAGLFVVLRIF